MRWTVSMILAVAGCSSDDDKDTYGALDEIPSDAVADADVDADADTDVDTDTDTDVDTQTATGDTGTTPCAVEVSDQFPDDGAVDIYFESDVWFLLSAEDPLATITVEDTLGNAVAGATALDGPLVTWSGDPLAPLTDYVATATWSCGVAVTHFTTSDVGEPLSLDPTGYVFSLDLSTGVWAQPPLLGPLLATQLGDADLLVTPTLVGTSTIDMLGAFGYFDVQDVCFPTLPFPGLAWTDPTFELVSPAVPVDVGGVAVDVTNVTVTGSFDPGATRIQFGTLQGTVDTRFLGYPLGLGSAYDSVCNLVATFGVSCDPCADGQVYCLEVSVSDLEAPNVPGTLIPRTLSDIAADPTCP